MPLSIFLIPYALLLLFVLIYGVIHVMHLAAYGATKRICYSSVFVFLLGTFIILAVTGWQLADVQWQNEFKLTIPTDGILMNP